MPGLNILSTLYRWTVILGTVVVDIPSQDHPSSEDTTSEPITTGLVSLPVESEIRGWLTEWWQP